MTAEPSASNPVITLYDALAADYETHFAVAHRRAYDELAWELFESELPPAPAHVVDVGCGVGRWVRRLIDAGYDVTGIEQSPAMAAGARERVRSERFHLVESPVEAADLADGCADAVVAMGSVQYCADPQAVFARMSRWVRPGGCMAVLVDSHVALVAELLAAGKTDEALTRLRTGRAVWTQDGVAAQHWLFTRDALRASLSAAGLADIRVHGLLVGSTALGRDQLAGRLGADYDAQLDLERTLMGSPAVADLGKHLFAIGTRPVTT